jgi:hypothetical protein
MLLNKINVLDKGFVALVDSSGNAKLLQDLQDTYFKTKINLKLLELSSATFIIKCPLFVQLNLSQFGFDIVSTPSSEVEAYLPDISSVSADTLEDRQRIVNYIHATTDALLLNHKGFSMDGADHFTSQMLTPINVYNEIIVSGNLKKWIAYLNQKTLPVPLAQYQTSIKSALLTEWKNLEQLLKIVK